MDLVATFKTLVKGGDNDTVRALAQVVVDGFSERFGEPYELVPVNRQQTPAQAHSHRPRGGVKKTSWWAKKVESVNYAAVPNGYAVQGGWASPKNLRSSSCPDGTLVMVKTPNDGIVLGRVKGGATSFVAGNGSTISDFDPIEHFPDGDYRKIIEKLKALGVSAT